MYPHLLGRWSFLLIFNVCTSWSSTHAHWLQTAGVISERREHGRAQPFLHHVGRGRDEKRLGVFSCLFMSHACFPPFLSKNGLAPTHCLPGLPIEMSIQYLSFATKMQRYLHFINITYLLPIYYKYIRDIVLEISIQPLGTHHGLRRERSKPLRTRMDPSCPRLSRHEAGGGGWLGLWDT